MAVKELQRMNADAELRQVLEQRAKEAHAVASLRGEGFREGERKGRAEGRAEGRVEGAREANLATAHKLLSAGMPPAEVAKYTGLSVAEIEALERG